MTKPTPTDDPDAHALERGQIDIDEFIQRMYQGYRDAIPTHPSTSDCPDPECQICAMRDCPRGDPMHYDKDGCTTCTPASERLIQPVKISTSQ